MADRTKTAMTPNQSAHLCGLLRLGATERRLALSSADPGMGNANPGVMGILIDKGFVLKGSRTRTGSMIHPRRVIYWLTPAGAVKARELEPGLTQAVADFAGIR